jgi:hypothetical protein
LSFDKEPAHEDDILLPFFRAEDERGMSRRRTALPRYRSSFAGLACTREQEIAKMFALSQRPDRLPG